MNGSNQTDTNICHHNKKFSQILTICIYFETFQSLWLTNTVIQLLGCILSDHVLSKNNSPLILGFPIHELKWKEITFGDHKVKKVNGTESAS